MSSEQLHLSSIANSSVIETMQANQQKIGHIDLNNQRIWIKESQASHSNFLHHCAYKISKITLLIPVMKKSATETLNYESQKLRQLAELNIHVPEVIGTDDRYLYLTDSGQDLRSYFKKNKVTDEERTDIILRAIELLSQIHKAGHYHAGAQIKNYTIDTHGVISAIDFEDSFSDQYSLIDLQIRDLFLFLLSLNSYADTTLYQKVIEHYSSLTGQEQIKERLGKLAQQLSPFLKVLGFITKHAHVGNDVSGTYLLLSFLATLI